MYMHVHVSLVKINATVCDIKLCGPLRLQALTRNPHKPLNAVP